MYDFFDLNLVSLCSSGYNENMSQTLLSDTDADHDPVARLAYIRAELADVPRSVSVALLDDAESLAFLDAVEQVGRCVDGARVSTTADVARRADVELYGGPASLSKRMGCTGKIDLITSVTHTSKREVLRRISLGADTAPSAGLGRRPAVFPAVFPPVSAALAAGEIGVHLAEVIVKGVIVKG